MVCHRAGQRGLQVQEVGQKDGGCNLHYAITGIRCIAPGTGAMWSEKITLGKCLDTGVVKAPDAGGISADDQADDGELDIYAQYLQ